MNTWREEAVGIKARICAALRRAAVADAEHIHVQLHDGRVVLRGHVRSRAEHDDAVAAAWSAPGVLRVEDQLEVTS